MKLKINIKKLVKTFVSSILIGILVLTLILSAGAVIAYLDYNHLKNAHLGFFDNCALQVWYTFQGYIEDELNFPNDKTIIITGKCHDPFNMTAFANEYMKEDTVIADFDSKAEKGKYYWAVKIVDGKVSEAWFGKKEINESDMRRYNDKERFDQMKFVIPILSPVSFFKYGYIDDSGVYGYYRSK